jgi:galactonate dehydratase
MAASSGPLEIKAVHAYPVREPVSRRTYTLIKVETRSGLSGFGETGAVNPADVGRAAELVRPRQASEYEVIRPLLAPMPGLQAAVNMALLDILGKHVKAPVYQVLGGPTRHKARALALLEGATDDTLRSACGRAREAGYRAFIVPVPPVRSRNQGQAFVLAARRRLDALRSDSGENMDFVLDGAGALAPGDGASLAAAFEKFHLLWLDEPCPVSNLEAMRKIAAERVTPIGFGRHIHRAGEFQDLLREDAIDILRPDLALNGISAIRRMAAIAETYYVAVAPHHQGGPVATAAALHLAASLPNFFIQQIPLPASQEDRRMRAELAGPVETVSNGFAALPAGPGLGITVNEQALEKYKERG